MWSDEEGDLMEARNHGYGEKLPAHIWPACHRHDRAMADLIEFLLLPR